VQLLFVILFFEPKAVFELPGKFTTFEFFEGSFYLAQFDNRVITITDSARTITNLFIPIEQNLRIYAFKITPFSIYIHLSEGIIRMLVNSGISEKIYPGDVVSFVLTDAEEVVLADRLKNGLIFLDADRKVRLIRKNINVVDMAYYDNKIYVLTRKEIIVLDDHGNTLELIKLPEKMDRIAVYEEIYLFSMLSSIMYKRNGDWKRIEIREPIIDLKIFQKNIFALTQYGNYIHIYDKSDF
jgi:hypothetical protein